MTKETRTNPFIGLRKFTEADSVYFFGRDEQINALDRKLQDSRFVAIVGSSGCGKSSLVLSGLVPGLRSNRFRSSRDSWSVWSLQPGFRPLESLAMVLSRTREQAQDLHNALGDGDVNAVIAHFSRLGVPRERENILLIVDQFEEIFRFRERTDDAKRRDASREESANFVSLLLELSKSELPIYVVVTMRSDFIGACDAFLGLPEALNEGQFLVPRLTRKQLRQVIIGPPGLWKITLDTRLVDRMLNDSAMLRISRHAVGESTEGADELPLLEHALMRTWTTWWTNHGPQPVPNAAVELPADQESDRAFIEQVGQAAEAHPPSVEDYERAGGINGAITQHAREALRESDGALAGRGGEVVRRIFQTLTDTDGAGLRTRRPAQVKELAEIVGVPIEDIAKALGPFARSDRSFVLLNGRLDDPKTSVDICHESLIRRWEDLDKWSLEEAESVALYRDLVTSAQDYRRKRKGLWTNPQLLLAKQWKKKNSPTASWGARRGDGYRSAMRFLNRSLAWHYLRIAGWVGAGVVLLLTVSVAACSARQTAFANRLAAESNRLAESDPLGSIRLALDAISAAPLPMAISALQNAMSLAGGRSFQGAASIVSSDGKWLITWTSESFGDQRSHAGLRFRFGRWSLEQLTQHSEPIGTADSDDREERYEFLQSVEYVQNFEQDRPNSQRDRPQIAFGTTRAVVQTSPNSIREVDLEKWEPSTVFGPDKLSLSNDDRIEISRVTPDDRWMLVSTNMGRVLRCDLQSTTCDSIVTGEGHIIAMEVARDRLAVLWGHGSAQLLSLSDPGRACKFDSAPVTSLAFGPDGESLIVGQSNGIVEIHRTDSQCPSGTPAPGQGAPVKAVAMVTLDGQQRVVVGDENGRIEVRDVLGSARTRVLKAEGEGPVVALRANPNGHWIAAAFADSVAVRLWDLASLNGDTPEPALFLLRGDGSPRDVNFSVDNHWLVTTDSWGSHLWDLHAPDPSLRTVLHDKHQPERPATLTLGRNGKALWAVSETESGFEVCSLQPDGQLHVHSEKETSYEMTSVPTPSTRGARPSRSPSPPISSPDGTRFVKFADGQPNTIGAWRVELDKVAGAAPTTGSNQIKTVQVPVEADASIGITAISFGRDGQSMILAKTDASVHVLTYLKDKFVDSGIKILGERDTMRPIKAVALHQANGETVVASADSSGRVSVVRVASSGDQTKIVDDRPSKDNLLIKPTLIFSDDGRWLLASAEIAPEAYVFDLRASVGTKARKLDLKNLMGGTTSASFVRISDNDATARWLIVGTADGWVHLFDTRNWSLRYGAGAHDRGVTTIGVSPDLKSFVTGGDDGRAILWNIDDEASNKVVLGLPKRDGIASAIFLDSSTLVTVSRSGVARQWSVSREVLRRQALSMAGRMRPDEQDRYRESWSVTNWLGSLVELMPSRGR
jgi:WD40 repeat protein/energy-coupling factor transporter ATP-binding protein EcfA2